MIRAKYNKDNRAKYNKEINLRFSNYNIEKIMTIFILEFFSNLINRFNKLNINDGK